MSKAANPAASKEIAGHLGISVHAVRNYLRIIHEKLHVHSKVEAVNQYCPKCGSAKTMAVPDSQAFLCYTCKHEFTPAKSFAPSASS